ncbi:helix-turn-helix domain-containing protein [Actinacidiphila acididurans]|uniref:Helix-turn-helix transcriptional regulator n=1 Tax=Actinacidiphila acididurans TaxID=2784346 RepID=A0ABS2TWW4_9ACTN|nr:helix-turn-helix transcriptional regulator [Actinacidiphila acididurans]MBM9507829.1 helix-turn-helix transcriptional regulator [Actinacidiphila acididurans]
MPAWLGNGEPETSDSLKTFGAVVQALREFHGMSREELGLHVRLSKHTIASIEYGRRMPDVGFAERADAVLGGTGALPKAVGYLARQPGLAAWFRQWARLEAHAITLYTYDCRVVPGLLQTEAYARALFEERLPPLSDEEIESQWEARAERQRLLYNRPNTAFSFVLDEPLLRRQTGGAGVTRELIDHVLDLSQRRNIEIQVLPQNTGVHPGLDGPIVLLETPDNRWFAYNEGQESGQLISALKVVNILQMRYAKLRSQSLSSEDSVRLLKQLRGEL